MHNYIQLHIIIVIVVIIQNTFVFSRKEKMLDSSIPLHTRLTLPLERIEKYTREKIEKKAKSFVSLLDIFLLFTN